MTVSVEVTGVVTAAGIAASIAAGRSGPQIVVTGYHIGENSAMEGAVAASTDTEVDGLVYSGGIADMSYSQVNADTVVWRIRLDSTVGNFYYGNVGLVLQDGSLFCKAVMPGRDYKYESDGAGGTGNNRYINILLRLANAASLINLTFISSLDCNLPEVADETRLPSPSTTVFDTYLVDNHTRIGNPTTSVRFNNAWWHAAHRLMPGQGQGIMPVGGAIFATNPTGAGLAAAPALGPVAYDPATNLFVAADGNDPELRAVGLRTSTFEITTLGVVTAANAGWGNTDSGIALLYVGADGAAGTLTDVPTGDPVAVVQPNGDLYVDTTGSWRGLGTESVLASLLALVAYEARQRRSLRKQVGDLQERVFQLTRVLASGVYVGGIVDTVQSIVTSMLSASSLPLETYALTKAINANAQIIAAMPAGVVPVTSMLAFVDASTTPGDDAMRATTSPFAYSGGDFETLVLVPWLEAPQSANPPGVGIDPTAMPQILATLRVAAANFPNV